MQREVLCQCACTRVVSERCHAAGVVSQLRCTNSYSDDAEETKNFAPGWVPTSWVHGYNDSAPWSSRSRLERAFLFTRPTEDTYSYGGKIATYPGGGYVADLTENPDRASSLIRELEASGWCDQYTRAVLIEFNVLNPNSKLFNQVILAFEYTTDGSALWTFTVDVVQLYRYAGSAGVVALFSEIICGIFILVITVIEIVKICRLKLRYFKEVWNVLQWCALVLFYIAVVLYTLRSLWTVWVVEDLKNNPGQSVNTSYWGRSAIIIIIIIIIIPLLCQNGSILIHIYMKYISTIHKI